MIERILTALLVLAVAAAAGGIIWAVRRGNQKRARLAAVYDELQVEDTEPIEVPPPLPPQQSQVTVRTIPPAPVPPLFMSSEPLRPAYSSRPTDREQPLFAVPVPLGDELDPSGGNEAA